jgi:hypothetical protein
MSHPICRAIAALPLIAALASSPLPAGAAGATTNAADEPLAGPARIVEAAPAPAADPLPVPAPAAPAPATPAGPRNLVNLFLEPTPQPLLSPEGNIVGSFTDGALGLPAQPLNSVEEAKLALARQAIAAAEAAGTRMVTLAERPGPAIPSLEELERIKLERLATQAPQPMAQRPGTSSGAAASSAPPTSPAPPESEVKP